MAQKVYRGTMPYGFVSYSHKDKDLVFEIINDLMICACNLWYDTGIHSGKDFNDEIAKHLFNAECVLFMITSNSIQSEYVKDELNFAKSKQIQIYPIYLEDVTLPLSLELLLGRTQAISLFDDDVGNSRFKLREKIKNSLPRKVFQTISKPFYASEHNLYYIENTSCVFPSGEYFAGEEHNSFEISIVDATSKAKSSIFSYSARPAYDMTYSLNTISVFDDPYFCDDDSPVLFLSLALSFCGRYPARLPDFDVVLTIAISRIDSEKPRVTLVDYKCIGDFSAKEQAVVDQVVREIEQSFVKK